MHHLYPASKGDQLCPLGFHPQVRWPTRCKRCFRDYKEHGGKKSEDKLGQSSPSLSEATNSKSASRVWTSTQNLSSNETNSHKDIELRKRPISWTSTPDLDENQIPTLKKIDSSTETSINVKLPQRRHTTILDTKELEDSFTIRRPPIPPSSPSRELVDEIVILKTDSLAERVRKMNLLKKQNSLERESSRERSVPRATEKEKTPDVPRRRETTESSLNQKELEPAVKKKSSLSVKKSSSTSMVSKDQDEAHKKDVQFLMHIKDSKINSKTKSDDMSSMTTETTIVPAGIHRELKQEIEKLQEELLAMKSRAEKAEREKSDLLLRRLASFDTAPNRTAASEALKLQQKVNDMKAQLEELKDDKRSLSVKIRELENGSSKAVEDELKRKLNAAEQLCEELMDENNDVKKELRGIQQEMEEIHDSFRDDQSVEFTNVKKELEAQTKNCRILSFKLKKSERKIETLEQEKQTQTSSELTGKVKRLEDDLKLANELSKRLQNELDQNKNIISKKTPALGTIGKSTSADSGRYTRASLTRGGSQEDPQQLLRDLQDSMERETDLKEQLKFAEEEAETARKKASRLEDENESLMMQLKKMATRARSRKLSPTPPNRLVPEPIVERDEGISDEDDPAELRVLLELNEQEASVLRLKVDDLENENKEFKKQIKELQEKVNSESSSKKSIFSTKSSSTVQLEKKLKVLEDETSTLRKSIIEKDKSIERLNAEIVAASKTKKTDPVLSEKTFDIKKQLQVVEQESTILRTKITTLEKENEKLLIENKKLLMQTARKNSVPNVPAAAPNSEEVTKLKDSLFVIEMERNLLKSKLKCMRLDAENKLPQRVPKNPTDMITRPTLKKWVEDLETEIDDLRCMLWNCSAEKQNKLEDQNDLLEKQLKEANEKLEQKGGSSKDASSNKEFEQKYKKAEDESKKLLAKIKDLEDKIKKQEIQIKLSDKDKDKDKYKNLEKDYDKEKKERQQSDTKVKSLEDELSSTKKELDKMKVTLEKEIKDLKSKVSVPKADTVTSKQLQDIRKQNEDLLANINKEMKKNSELNTKYDSLSEENILLKAQLNIEKQNVEKEKNSIRLRQSEMDNIKAEKSELGLKLKNFEKKIKDLESKNIKSGAMEYEKERAKNLLSEKQIEYDRLKKENEMNIEIVFQLRKDNEDLNKKLSDFNRINKVQSSMTEHSSNLENEIKKLRMRLENAELNTKSEVASTRLRYEQQAKNLNVELNAMQRQCERFKKDRDTFKQLLESAQKQITDLKHNSGRLSRSSKSSGDEDDKSKILNLEQQIGCLEDQLVEFRLDASKYKNQLISERTENEIKISEMQSKLNEYEEDRLISTGRSKIAGMKTKLELSWQKEREEQQRILQETSTLARDLRQTLFEVERERDKERLEAKRKIDQFKRSQEEEIEEGRKKVSELQCDLLELRDAHAKLRTSNEKLRRERERYERELTKKRMEPDGERKVGALLQTVDELVKIAPDLKKAGKNDPVQRNNTLQPATDRRSRSPSPSGTHISNILARLAEASDELRKYQRQAEEENERNRVRRGNLRRAASTENDGNGNSGAMRNSLSGKISRSSTNNSSLYRKSLSLDQTNQQDQSIWRQDDGSMSSIQSIDSEMGGGLIRDSDLDSRLSGGSTQSDVPRGPRKKKRSLMGKLRSLTKSGKSSETEGSVQGSDSDVSMSSDIRSSKKDLRNRLSGMFKRSGSTSRASSSERVNELQRPVAVSVASEENGPYSPTANTVTPKPISRITSVTKPPTPTTPVTRRRVAK